MLKNPTKVLFLVLMFVLIVGCGDDDPAPTELPSIQGTRLLGWAAGLVRVDLQDESLESIGFVPFFTSMFHDRDGQLYGVNESLVRVDPQSGQSEKVLDFLVDGVPVLMTSAALDAQGQLLVLENGDPSRLFRVDMESGAMTDLGPRPALIRTIHFAPDGRLIASFFDVFELDPETMEVVRKLGRLSRPMGCLARTPDGSLYGSETSGATIWKVDFATLSMTNVVTFDVDLYALVWDRPVLAKQALWPIRGEVQQDVLGFRRAYAEAVQRDLARVVQP